MKNLRIFFLLASAITCRAQNIIPNPSFENLTATYTAGSLLSCALDWNDNSVLLNPAMNSADLQFNGSTFFTSINAYDGNRFAALDCGASNPEYIQVKMTSPMVAGTTYCVSFYTSLYTPWSKPSPFIGAYFSNSRLTVNPYVAGISAHVQSAGATDPANWIQVSGTYIAAGGEEYMTLGCFQDNVPIFFSYNYIDMVDVHPMDIAVDLGPDRQVCADLAVQLDAGNDGTGYLWNTGETAASITTTVAGVYWVEKFSGACPVTDTIKLFNTGCIEPIDPVKPVDPVDPVPADSIVQGALFIPNAFSPDGDGLNDFFGAKGENIRNFEMVVFNRWGERIFKSSEMNDFWNGTTHGHEAPPGVYVYTINYENGRKKNNLRGHVTLVR